MAHHDQDVYWDEDDGFPCQLCLGTGCELCCHSGSIYGTIRIGYTLTPSDIDQTISPLPPRRAIAREWTLPSGVQVREIQEDGDGE